MAQHRLERVRPRYGRVLAAVASLGVTVVALLGGIGLLPSSPAGSVAQDPAMVLDSAANGGGAGSASQPSDAPSDRPSNTPIDPQSETAVTKQVGVDAVDEPTYPLPPKSGHGKRVVFSEAEQRVWLVGADGTVQRTYLVSGSLTDNLQPGTYAVYSRSEQAWGINDSGTMKWFVRFATGNSAAIGFHDIPVDDGKPLQTVAQLGTPQSHGCIRQKESDAKALWRFAPLDTEVVVTA